MYPLLFCRKPTYRITNIVSLKETGWVKYITLFNCIVDNNLDKSTPQTMTGHKSSRILRNVCKDLGLTDIWRELHLKDRNCTFYSHPHNSYSRLDYFFAPSDCIHQVKSCCIGPIVLSDHSPVYLDLDVNLSIPKSNY